MAALFLFVIILVLFFYWFYVLLQKKYSYWKNLNIPHLKPKPIVGNYGEYLFLKKTMGQVTQEICEKFPNEPMIGVYFGTEPALVVQDPELLKQVTTTDFTTFNSRDNMDYIHKEFVGYNLFFAYGDRWRVLRQNLSPLFSTGKLKQMFYLVEKCADTLEISIENELQSTNTIEITDLMKRYTLATIGACVFNVDAHTLENKEKSPFVKLGDVTMEHSAIRAFFWAIRCMWPGVFYGLGLSMLPSFIQTAFSKLMTNIYEQRNYKPSGKNDFIDLMLQLWDKKIIIGDGYAGDKLSLEVNEDFLVSQGVLFFAAGFETSSVTLTFTLYELAKNQEAQERAAEEVDAYLAKRGGRLDWDCVSELTWTWACCSEALRLYPVLGALTREATREATLGHTRLIPGSRILLPVQALHRCVPDPETFQPQRWLPSSTYKTPPAYMPFGDGPRTCIGMRFAKMQMMPALVTILKKYKLELAEGTPKKLQLSTHSIATCVKGDVRLKFTPRTRST